MSEVFVKHGSAPGAAAAEAAYLRWLREGSAAVVEVLELDETANTVTIERVDSVRPTVDAAREAGQELAAIHAMGAAAFGAPADGWDGPNFIGTRRQTCEPTERWATFYVEQRVLPFAHKAAEAGNLGGGDVDVVKQASSSSRRTRTPPWRASTATCGLATSCSGLRGRGSSTLRRMAATR